MMNKKNNTTKATAVAVVIARIISIAMMVAYIFKNKFTRKEQETRKIGNYIVTLSKDPMIGIGMMAETTIGDGMSIEVRTDLFFKLLTQEMQNVVLAHEIGHHIIKEARPSWYQITRDVDQEVAADAFAVMVYGKKQVVKLLTIMFLISFDLEILVRIYFALRGKIVTIDKNNKLVTVDI